MKYNKEDFIREANEKFHDFFSYKKVVYKNKKTNVIITCPIHGDFKQKPFLHLSTYGCKKCSIEKGIFTNGKKTKEDFIREANEIHNNFFDYSLVNYVNNKTKVKIICPTHGLFEQTPLQHIILKEKCRYCMIDNYKKTKEDFIREVNEIHNNFFDYSLVNYVNNKTKVKIICPKHGVFEQKPNNHLVGQGCPKCKISKGEKKIQNYLSGRNICFVEQKKFLLCKDKLQLPFDFYLPEQNLCIEYDGRQHFEKIDYFGGEKTLQYIQKHDKIKNDFCKVNKIKLMRISYKNIKNIDIILKENGIL